MLTNQAHFVSFAADRLKLSGVLHRPSHQPWAAIVGCHGLMADKNSPKQLELARRCTDAGMAYFRFDHRGCGESEGVFATDTTLENRVADLVAAVQAAKKAVGTGTPIGLFGSSLGGAVCLGAAPRVTPFAMVTLAAPVQSRMIHLPENSPQSLKSEVLQNRLDFNLTIQQPFVHHILIIHGSKDEIVAVENAHRIFNLAGAPKKQLILENGDHRISERSHQKRFVETAVQWMVACYTEQFPGKKKAMPI